MDLDKIFIKTFLNNFEEEDFTVKLWDGEEVKLGQNSSKFKVTFNEPLKKNELLKSTSLALGEAYVDGKLEVEGDFYTMLNSILKYKDRFTTDFKGLPKLFSNKTNAKKQKEEVTFHYDLGNDFYKLWLDDTMSYSCAYFKNENDTLYDAQMNKIHHLLRKLNLKEGQSLLDIVCGWGALFIEAAK